MVDGTLETADCHIKLFHGYGDIAYPNGEKYRGKLNEVDGSAEGKGMLLAPMGPFNRMEVLYDGEFRDSKFHGRGVLYETASYFLYLKKWKLYEGEFEEGKYHGHGKKYEYSQFGPDVVYEGTFVQGQMEGWVVVRQNQAIIRVERWENGQCVEAKPHP